MAVDTRDKRFSMLGFANPFRLVLPNPDGTIDQADRQQFAYLYRGFYDGGGGGPVTAVFLSPLRVSGPL
jgi:hypothetical protein